MKKTVHYFEYGSACLGILTLAIAVVCLPFAIHPVYAQSGAAAGSVVKTPRGGGAAAGPAVAVPKKKGGVGAAAPAPGISPTEQTPKATKPVPKGIAASAGTAGTATASGGDGISTTKLAAGLLLIGGLAALAGGGGGGGGSTSNH